jgi:hypothetical protein
MAGINRLWYASHDHYHVQLFDLAGVFGTVTATVLRVLQNVFQEKMESSSKSRLAGLLNLSRS